MLAIVDADGSAFIGRDICVWQIEVCGVWAATESVANVGGVDGFGFAVLGERNRKAACCFVDRGELGVGENLHAFLAECLRDNCGCFLVEGCEQVGAALDESYFGADALEELCEFAGDDAAAEHHERWWQEIQIEHVVAGPDSIPIESVDVRGIHD